MEVVVVELPLFGRAKERQAKSRRRLSTAALHNSARREPPRRPAVWLGPKSCAPFECGAKAAKVTTTTKWPRLFRARAFIILPKSADFLAPQLGERARKSAHSIWVGVRASGRARDSQTTLSSSSQPFIYCHSRALDTLGPGYNRATSDSRPACNRHRFEMLIESETRSMAARRRPAGNVCALSLSLSLAILQHNLQASRYAHKNSQGAKSMLVVRANSRQ